MTEISKRFFNAWELLGYTKEDIKKWRYCGGDYDTASIIYFYKYHSQFPKPDKATECICKQSIIKNSYITDDNIVRVIGICCKNKFLLPDQKHKTCEKCKQAHKNTKDNRCNNCRIKVAFQCYDCDKQLNTNFFRCYNCNIKHKEKAN